MPLDNLSTLNDISSAKLGDNGAFVFLRSSEDVCGIFCEFTFITLLVLEQRQKFYQVRNKFVLCFRPCC